MLKQPETMGDIITLITAADLPPTRQRDMISAIKRISQMAGSLPQALPADPPVLRRTLARILPAAHGVSEKSLSTMRSAFGAALRFCGVIDDTGRGRALRHPLWGPLLRAVSDDRRHAGGLAAFANWCSLNDIGPEQVSDAVVQQFSAWLQARTLHLKPNDIVCAVPRLWNEASERVSTWPRTKLSRLSFRPPRRRLAWEDLSEAFREDANSYLAMRADPDLFDDHPDVPRRPLVQSTLAQQREHLRLAASVLVESGMDALEIISLADLVQPERVKTVLRHYLGRADGRPNAFVICLAQTLRQVAKYHVRVSADTLDELKRLIAKLPSVPFELTPKNKALMRQLESERLRATLLYLPEDMSAEAAKAMTAGALPFVEAQVAIALDIQLTVPLRPQNLCGLEWRRHFQEPEGPRSRLLLHVPAEETKSKRKDLTFEIPIDVAQRLRWYRRHILPRLGADPDGPLFVTRKGRPKIQETVSHQITETIAKRVGIHMTPHQFRHFCAVSYLESHPEDFHTVQTMLGHGWSKTTLIYAGSSSRRAGRAYSEFLFKEREKLKLNRAGKRKKRCSSRASPESRGDKAHAPA